MNPEEQYPYATGHEECAYEIDTLNAENEKLKKIIERSERIAELEVREELGIERQ